MLPEPSCFTKYCLFYFNVLVWFFGVVVLSIGIWAITEKGFFDHVSEVSSLSFDPVILLITIAIITILISFMGFVGSIRENITLLHAFSVCLTSIFIVEFIFGVLGFAYSNWFFDKFDQFLNRTIKDYREDPDLQNLIDFTQQYLQCCGGATGPNDWDNNIYFNCSSLILLNGLQYRPTEACGVPYSCCIQSDNFVRNSQCGYGIREPAIPIFDRSQVIYAQGCLESFEDWLKINLYTVAGVFIVVALIQIVPLVFAQNLREQILEIEEFLERRYSTKKASKSIKSKPYEYEGKETSPYDYKRRGSKPYDYEGKSPQAYEHKRKESKPYEHERRASKATKKEDYSFYDGVEEHTAYTPYKNKIVDYVNKMSSSALNRMKTLKTINSDPNQSGASENQQRSKDTEIAEAGAEHTSPKKLQFHQNVSETSPSSQTQEALRRQSSPVTEKEFAKNFALDLSSNTSYRPQSPEKPLSRDLSAVQGYVSPPAIVLNQENETGKGKGSGIDEFLSDST